MLSPERRLAAALPALTDASPAQHARAAARMAADVNGGGK